MILTFILMTFMRVRNTLARKMIRVTRKPKESVLSVATAVTVTMYVVFLIAVVWLLIFVSTWFLYPWMESLLPEQNTVSG